MTHQVRVSCPMDCPDLCRFIVTVQDNRVKQIKGDPNHPLTRGVICQKGRRLLDRLYHPERLRHPLMKEGGRFVKISWDRAFDLMSEKLTRIRETLGPSAVLNYGSDGYGGSKARMQHIFFNLYGGATLPEGSLCWGAGIAAQKYDFGNPRGNFPTDVLNSDLVLLWGRNPANTSLHLFSLLKKARKKGSRVVVIDPVRTDTARAFDKYVRIRPSSDAVLALAMARVIIRKGMHDKPFVKEHVIGFNRFKKYVDRFTLETAQKETGIDARQIEELALAYASAQTACIYIGFGLQRYHNGGNTVRAIDALGAITGKIGRSGCGVNYAAKSISSYLSAAEQKSLEYRKTSRSFIIGELGSFLSRADDPPIKAAFVSGGNPMTQSPDLNRTTSAFKQVEFKVVFDHFLTDTARMADLVLPAAMVFEQEDLFAASMYSPVLNYSQKAIDPPEGVIPEFEVYLKLAGMMGLDSPGFTDSRQYLEMTAAPLLDELGVCFEDLVDPDQYHRLKAYDIAWKNLVFETPSKKIELYSETALNDGQTPMASYRGAMEAPADFPVRLITPHARQSLHSQGFVFTTENPVVRINSKTAAEAGVNEKSKVRVVGANGSIKARLEISDDIDDTVACIFQGFWHKSGSVNFLTDPVITDMGRQAAYYDSFCRIEPL